MPTALVSPLSILALLAVAGLIGYVIGARLATARALTSRRELEVQLNSRDSEIGRLQGELTNRRVEVDSLTRRIETEVERRANAETRVGRIAELEQENRELSARATSDQQRINIMGAEKADLAARLEAAEGGRELAVTNLQAATENLETERSARETLSNQLAEVRARLEAAEALVPSIEAIKAQMSSQFESLASKTLTENAQTFTQQHQTSLGTLLEPLRERLQEFQRRVEETHSTDIRERVSLKAELERLEKLNRQMAEDAVNLTNALKGNSKSQGTWGEIVLDTILETSGLREGHEFERQTSQTDEDGNRLQPDVVVHLPEDRHIVIDAKVSLTAFEQYASAASDEEQDAALRAHLLSVRSHVKKLSDKNYQSLYGLKSLDFVVMFIPVEPAFMLAVNSDRELYRDAWRRNVVLVSPTTLLVTLRITANLWMRQQQSQNAQEIAKQSASLYDKFVGFVTDLELVGKRLEDTRDAYSSARKKLSIGRDNLVRQVERIRQLGVKPTKALPQPLLDNALSDDSDTNESPSGDNSENPIES